MGDRLNIALVSEGRRTLYRSKWGGDDLDFRLFFGPERALAYARENREADRDGGWYGDEAQGGALIDCDGRRLLWFGGADLCWDVRLRAAWMALAARRWPGWRLDWAVDGIYEIRSAFGETVSPYRVATEGFARDREDALLGDMLLSWRSVDGSAGARRMNGAIDALWVGPKGAAAALDALKGAPRWREGDDGWFDAGAHIDFEAQRLAFWSAQPTPFPEHNAARAWRGWEVVWLRDDLDAHRALAPDAPLEKGSDPAALRGAILAALRARVGSDAALRGILDALEADPPVG